MANTIARLGVRLGIDSAEFTQGIEAAKKGLVDFASKAKVYAEVGAAAFTAMTYKALQFGDAISDVAKANDVAIKTVLKLGEALQQNGGNAENAGKILSSFTAFVDKAASGSFDAQKSFQDVGVSLKDLGNLNIEDLFSKTLKGLKDMPDTLTRNARSMEMFGKAAKGVAIADLADDMEKVNKLTEEQIKAIKDAGDAWDLLEKRTHDTTVAFTAFIGTPALKLVEWLGELPKLIDKSTMAFQNLFYSISFVSRLSSAVISRDVDEIKKLAEEYRKIQTDIGMGKFDPGSGSGWDAETKKIDDSQKRLTKKGVDPEAQRAEALRLQQLHFMIAQRQKEGAAILANTKLEVEAYYQATMRQEETKRSLINEQKLFEFALAGKHMRAEDYKMQVDLYEIESKRLKNIEEIRHNNDLSDAAKKDLIRVENELADTAERNAVARNQATKAAREGTFGEGFGMAARDAFLNISTDLELGQQAFETTLGNMNAALDNFVRTGKISFKSLAQSIIQDILAIQLKSQMLSMFKGFGFFGSNEIGAAGGGGDEATRKLFGFADGGDPPVNKVSVVGERGPELFVPKTAGTIIPNNMMGSALGGTINITNNYINAIDTKSFEDRLLGSSKTIWAANKYGEKNLSLGTGRT